MKAHITTDEKDLLNKLRNGDKDAFKTLYDLYKIRLAANFVKLLRNDELAKDALQDLFIRVWNNRLNIDTEQSFRSYLFRIAENLVIDHYRKAARDKMLQTTMYYEDNLSYQHVEEQLFSKDNIALVRAIIDKLPEQQRRAYLLHKIEGNSYKDISELMGISTSTINKHIHYAHKFVKAWLLNSLLLISILVGTLLLEL